MSIIGWIVLGLIAGFIASKIVDARGQGLMLDLQHFPLNLNRGE